MIDDDHEEHYQRRGRGGRAAIYSDAPHFRKALAWFLGIVSTIISGVSVVGLVALFSMREDLSVIKQTMTMQNANLAERLARDETAMGNRLDNHDEFIRSIDGRVYVLEGKAQRGAMEPHRGN